jgi:hypothetical protein
MREIDGKAKTLRQLLSGTRYSIDYYQREYRWQPKQARELVEDLTDRFLQDYKPADPRRAVQGYGHNPGFLKFIKRSGLPFRPHPQFRRADLDARQQLYRQIAEQLWAPERIGEAAGV